MGKSIDSLDLFLESGGRKIDQWTSGLNCCEVLFDDAQDFININNIEDINGI